MTRKFARKTTVAVSKSRAEIDKCLRDFGADQLQWSDDFKNGHAMLRFIWRNDGVDYLARFNIRVPTEEEMRKEPHVIDGRSGQVSENKLKEALERRGMVEHRELALFIKAAFVAVEAGIIAPEQVFLPFLEGADGVTVSERVLPQMHEMLRGKQQRLLQAVHA